MKLSEITNASYEEMLENGLPHADYIEHGWLKDQAAKAHKYIERWRGKNGKWYYRYKSKAQELGTKIRRKKLFGNVISSYERVEDEPRKKNASSITTNYGRTNLYRHDIGKADYRSGSKGSRVNAGIEAGRKRAKKKATTERFNAHMASKSVRKGGYSGSRGSSSNNRATNAALKNQQTKRTMTNKIKNKRAMGSTDSRRVYNQKPYYVSGKTVSSNKDDRVLSYSHIWQRDFVDRANARHKEEQKKSSRTKSTKKRRRYLSGTGKVSTKSRKNLYQVKKGQTKSFYDYYKKK